MFLMWIVPIALVLLVVYTVNGNNLFKPAAGRTCPHCGQTTQNDWKTCPYCGQEL